MNTNNTNIGFQNIAESDYNLHWSFSNYLRWLAIAEQVNQLPLYANVLELGAGDSPLKFIMVTNFKRGDLIFTKVDAVSYDDIDTVMDIAENMEHFETGYYDCIILSEVIEHVHEKVGYILRSIYRILKQNGVFVLTTPTPPFDGGLEDRVWPDCHEYEFPYSIIYKYCNTYFEIERASGWSLKTREYNNLIKQNELIRTLYCSLKGTLPESMIRAIVSMVAPVQDSRQIIMVCKKRRAINA